MVPALQDITATLDHVDAVGPAVCRRAVSMHAPSVGWQGFGGSGMPSIRPADRAAPGAKYANLHCEGCVPPWEILEIDHRSPPWSLPAGVRFICPACGGEVDVREHGPPWRPTYDV